MTTAITGTKAELELLAANVDQEMGYPKPGEPVGGGTHAPPEQCVTLRHAALLEHPTTKGTFVYPLDATCRPIVADKQYADGAIASKDASTLDGEVELSADWYPPKDPVPAAPKDPAPVTK